MKYSELVTNIQTLAQALPISFYHYTEDHVNEYRGEFPVAILFPPSASLSTSPSGILSAATYRVKIAFMGLIDPSSSRSDKEAVVATQHNNAASFVITLMESEALFTSVIGNKVANVTIDPFFTFTWTSHLTAGVLLEFDYTTGATWDCASIPASTLPAPVISFEVGAGGASQVRYTLDSVVDISSNLFPAGLYQIGVQPFAVYEYKTASTDWVEFANFAFTVINEESVDFLDPGDYFFRSRYYTGEATPRYSQYSEAIEVTLS